VPKTTSSVDLLTGRAHQPEDGRGRQLSFADGSQWGIHNSVIFIVWGSMMVGRLDPRTSEMKLQLVPNAKSAALRHRRQQSGWLTEFEYHEFPASGMTTIHFRPAMCR